jgi:lipopolysaccharide heptosyltransferase II
MKKILVVTVNWLGDALMTTPVFSALKKTCPDCYLAVMANRRVRGIFEDNPYIDEIINFDDRGQEQSLIAKLKFIFALRKKKFDTVFLIHRSFTRALICLLGGIKIRIGYERPKNSFVLTQKIESLPTTLPRQDQYLNLFEKYGITINDKIPQFYIPQNIQQTSAVKLAKLKISNKFIVGINATANWDLKRWPAENFAKLSDKLIVELNCAVIFIGAKFDKSIIAKVTGLMTKPYHNFCGTTTLKELGAIIKISDLFISNDSGPAHLSACLGTPTIALFGPTSDKLTGPRGPKVTIINGKPNSDCLIPCYNLICADNVCMKTISIETIFNQAKQILLENAAKTI